MAYYGPRDIEAAPSGDTGAQAEFGVVRIGKEVLIKVRRSDRASILRYIAAQPSRPKDFFHFVVLAAIAFAGAAAAILAIGKIKCPVLSIRPDRPT